MRGIPQKVSCRNWRTVDEMSELLKATPCFTTNGVKMAIWLIDVNGNTKRYPPAATK
jgi:hypothetical protein